MQNIVAIIQARTSSVRLPGKVLIDIKGKTILEHVICRVQRSRYISNIVVATTDLAVDDAIIEECNKLNIDYFRGSSDDVLSRYYFAAKKYKAQNIIRITSDCPLFSGAILEEMIQEFFANTPDYLSNTITRTFPRGMDIEIMTFLALKKAYDNAQESYEKEHVTPYIYQNPEEFIIKQYISDNDNSDLRWTLDTREDLELIRKVYNSFPIIDFEYEQILDLFQKNSDLIQINQHIEQKKLRQ